MKKETINFVKMHGLGNDYIYIDQFENNDLKDINISKLAIQMSRYHYGIGSDGIIILKPGNLTEYAMEMYNADGTYSAMCGNGLRCLARYIYDSKALKTKHIEIQSGNVKYNLYIHNNDNVLLKFGKPEFDKSSIMLTDFKLEHNEILKFVELSMGNQHCVIFLDSKYELDKMDLFFYVEKLRAKLLKDVNFEFIKIKNKELFYQRTWEKGSQETLACGSGAIASFISAHFLGFLNNKATCVLKGGDLICFLEGDELFQLGPVQYVFKGIYNLNKNALKLIE